MRARPVHHALPSGFFSLIAALMIPGIALAWPTDPGLNLPLMTVGNVISSQLVAADGSGGAFVTWSESRTGSAGFDIYAHHILATGVLDPLWPAQGLPVCTAVAHQIYARVLADGAGQAIIVWQDVRNGSWDIYAHRVLSSGTVDPAWPANGRAVCTATFDQLQPRLVSDGFGGAVLAWTDHRAGGVGTDDIYAHHVLVSGVVDPTWPADGRALCTAPSAQNAAEMVEDDAGGAIVAWNDRRVPSDSKMYATRVLSSGAVDPAWPANGRLIGGKPGQCDITKDGLGGALIVWEDSRADPNVDLYVQHVSQSGVVDPTWPANGRAICTAANAQVNPAMVGDGTGGAFITWEDQRATDQNIYAQHLLGAGGVDPAWPADGLLLCADSDNQYNPVIMRSGADGVVVAWGDPLVKVQRALVSGTVDPRWPANGRALSTAPGNQHTPSVCPDLYGGVIAAWQVAVGGSWHVYAQSVAGSSSLGIDFTQAAAFTGVFRGACAWADVDGDDWLDLLVAGTDGSGSRTDVYRYNGDTWGTLATGLPGAEWSALAPGDFDGDGDIDVALCGWSNGVLVSGIHRNTGGVLTDIGAGLPGVIAGAVAWADVDNDGDLDLLLAGQRADASFIARLYRNNAGTFVDAGAGLTGVYHCDAAWADYDEDGDQDLVLAGHDGVGGVTKLYRNDGGTLVNSGAVLAGVWEGDVEWADWQNDGDLDLMVVGWDGTSRHARLYRNVSGSLSDAGLIMPGLSSSAGAWADIDNDGDQDFVAAGYSDGGGGLSTFARNDIAGPAEPAMTLPNLYYSATAWGDYDHDGNVDLAIAGIGNLGVLTEVQRSFGTTPNAPPSAPGTPAAVRNGNQVTFSWTAAADDRTPASALSYNLRVGTTAGGNQVMPAMAASGGRRRVAQLGNVGQRTSWTLTLPPGAYHFGVQAIDGAFLGSGFVQTATTGVGEAPGAELTLDLLPASPNPFRVGTEIAFALPRAGHVDLAVFDAAGRRVRSLANGECPAGVGHASWDGRDGGGGRVANGLYLIRLEAEGRRQTRKVVAMR